MIYLYAGLGMAMLLPILVGLQSAVYVAELEQGELAMQNSTSKILTEWEKSQDVKKGFRDDQLDIFKSSVPDLNCPEDAPKGFSKPERNECAYHSEDPPLDVLYITRIYQKNGVWKACIVPEIESELKCPEEYKLL